MNSYETARERTGTFFLQQTVTGVFELECGDDISEDEVRRQAEKLMRETATIADIPGIHMDSEACIELRSHGRRKTMYVESAQVPRVTL